MNKTVRCFAAGLLAVSLLMGITACGGNTEEKTSTEAPATTLAPTMAPGTSEDATKASQTEGTTAPEEEPIVKPYREQTAEEKVIWARQQRAAGSLFFDTDVTDAEVIAWLDLVMEALPETPGTGDSYAIDERVYRVADLGKVPDKKKDKYTDFNASTYSKILLSEEKTAGKGVAFSNGVYTISAEGTYVVTGEASDARIVVAAGIEEDVRLVLNGMSLSCKTAAPLFLQSADKVIISLPDGTENFFADETRNAEVDGETMTGCIFANTNMVINGNGRLTVNGVKDGLVTKERLKLNGGELFINAADDGIVGKDGIIMKAGNVTVNALGSGLKSTNRKLLKGYIYMEGGKVSLTVGSQKAVLPENANSAMKAAWEKKTGEGARGTAIHPHTLFILCGGEIRASLDGELFDVQNAAALRYSGHIYIDDEEVLQYEPAA